MLADVWKQNFHKCGSIAPTNIRSTYSAVYRPILSCIKQGKLSIKPSFRHRNSDVFAKLGPNPIKCDPHDFKLFSTTVSCKKFCLLYFARYLWDALFRSYRQNPKKSPTFLRFFGHQKISPLSSRSKTWFYIESLISINPRKENLMPYLMQAAGPLFRLRTYQACMCFASEHHNKDGNVENLPLGETPKCSLQGRERRIFPII